MSPRVRMAAVIVVLIVGAALLQSTVVIRLPWPGGIGPDLLLLVVIAIGLATSPNYAAVAGFGAGFLADVLPPDLTTLGSTAFVLALVGYLAGGVQDVRGLAWVQIAGVIAGLAMLSGVLQLALSWILADRAVDAVAGISYLLTFILFTTAVGLGLVPWLAGRLRSLDRRAYPRGRSVSGAPEKVRG